LRYKIIETQRRFNTFFIRLLDKQTNIEHEFYLDELSQQKLPGIKAFIMLNLKDIHAGKYPWLSIDEITGRH